MPYPTFRYENISHSQQTWSDILKNIFKYYLKDKFSIVFQKCNPMSNGTIIEKKISSRPFSDFKFTFNN